jgi:hypothetical protein
MEYDPCSYFFPHGEFFDKHLQRNRNVYEPMMGILNAVKLCSNGNQSSYFVKTSPVIDFAWPPLKVLDPLSKKIGEVRIPSIDSYILDKDLQGEIRKLLSKVKLKVEYESKAPPRYSTLFIICIVMSCYCSNRILHRILAIPCTYKNTETESWTGSKRCIRRYKKLTVDPAHDTAIMWISDDINEYGFTLKDGSEQERMVTVAEYFLIHHGLTIRYPKMPLSK